METMKLLLLFLIGITITFGLTDEEITNKWNKFKRDFQRKYPDDYEEGERKKIFVENLAKLSHFLTDIDKLKAKLSYPQTHKQRDLQTNNYEEKEAKEILGVNLKKMEAAGSTANMDEFKAKLSQFQRDLNKFKAKLAYFQEDKHVVNAVRS